MMADGFACLHYGSWTRCLAISSAAVLLLISAGCQTWQKSHREAISKFSSGQLEQSHLSLEKSLKSVRAEQNLIRLDDAIVDLAAGRPAEAEATLRTVRRELEHLSQSDITEKAGSVLTDDRAVAFSGKEFEQQMALNVLLISSLLNDGQDAFAYSMQLTEHSHARREYLAKAAAKQKDPAANEVLPAGFQKPVTGSVAAHNVAANSVATAGVVSAGKSVPPLLPVETSDQTLALGAYLSASVQSESPSRYQDTEAALREIGLWNPEFVQRASMDNSGEIGTRCQPGNGTLHIIAFMGNAPEWVPETSAPSSASLLIADRILSITGKHTLPPTIAPVKISRPQPVPGCPPPGFLRCSIGGSSAGAQATESRLAFHPLVDLNSVAEAHYQAHRDEELARAITRRVVKKGVVYVAKEAQKISRNTVVDLAVNVAGIAWEAMEKPDTRSWRLLPARIEVARSELPAGTWEASLDTSGGSGLTRFPVHIENGRNTYVVCFVPQRSLSGHVLVGGADSGRFEAGTRSSSR